MNNYSILLLTVLGSSLLAVPSFADDPTSGSAADAYATPPRPLKDASEDREIQKTLDDNLPDLRSSDRQKREMAISKIHHELPLAVRNAHRLPTMDTSRVLSEALIDVYTHTSANDFSSPLVRRDLIQTVALYGDDKIAKSFILRLLDKGNSDERTTALAVVGVLGVTGDEIYNEIQDLAKRHIVKPEERTTLLVRTNKERALPEVLKEITSSNDKKLVLYSAWALQEYYHDPSYYSLILPRLEALGFGKPNTFKNTNGLFWLKADLFAAYVDSAHGEELKTALTFMLEHDEVRRPSISPILIRKLDDGNPQVRALAAGILSHVASDYSQADGKGIKKSLTQALEREDNSTTKNSLQDALAHIERSEKDWQWTLERMHRKSK